MALALTGINAYTNDLIVPRMQDLIYESSPVFTRLHARNRERFTGGIYIRQPAMVAELNGGAAGRGEGFDISVVTTEAALLESMKLYWVNISLFGFDRMQNQEPQSVFDEIRVKMVNASQKMGKLLGTHMYLDNTVATKQLTGFPQWYDDGNLFPTIAGQTRSDIMAVGTVGGMNAYTVNLGASFTITALNVAYTQAMFGAEHPDLVVVTRNGWQLLWQSQQPLQRYTTKDNDLAKVGFENFRFNSADVVLDPLLPTGTNGVCYGMNTNFVEWWFTTNPDLYFGFTGFKPAQGSIDVAGQYLCGNQLFVPNPRTGFKVLSTRF